MITFQCSCGKMLKTGDDMAGRQVRCPACRQVVAVPAAEAREVDVVASRIVEEPADDLLGGDALDLDAADEGAAEDVQGPTKTCPACHVTLPAGAVLCTTCGYDFRTGKVFEPPKPFLLRIPWKKLGKASWAIAGLAIVVAVAYWAITKVQKTQEEEKKALASSSSAADKGAGKGAPLANHSAAIVVQTRYVRPTPSLRKGFKFQYDDGEYSAADAQKELRTQIRNEVKGRFLEPGHKVLASSREEPPPGAEVLNLRITVSYGWDFKRVGGKLMPKEPYVASCTAHLIRGDDVAIWTAPAPFAAPLPGEVPTPADLAAIAKLTSSKFAVNFKEMARKTAMAIVDSMLESIPSPGDIAGMLKRERNLKELARGVVAAARQAGSSARAIEAIQKGNQHVVSAYVKEIPTLEDKALLEAIAKHSTHPDIGPRAKARLEKLAAAAVPPAPEPKAKAKAVVAPPPAKKKAPTSSSSAFANADKALLKLAETKFAGEPTSLKDELRLVGAVAGKTPFLALAFARAAVAIEEDEEVRKAYRNLCTAIASRNQPIQDPEVKALRALATAKVPGPLVRGALRSLVAGDAEGALDFAETYLAGVAAGRIDAPTPDAADQGLSEVQMAFLSEVAAANAERGCELAAAFLMRASAAQRGDVRAHISLPAAALDRARSLKMALNGGDPETIRNELLRAVQKGVPLRPLLDVLAILVADHHDNVKVRAAALYALAKSAKLKEPYLWRLVDMVRSTDGAERKEGADRLRRLGADAAGVVGELQKLVVQEKTPSIKAALAAAIRAAGGEVEGAPKSKTPTPTPKRRRPRR
ncbi:hypothetical protein HQ576_00225 [bacterium]|nr:hypothetical protein [bacterium]